MFSAFPVWIFLFFFDDCRWFLGLQAQKPPTVTKKTKSALQAPWAPLCGPPPILSEILFFVFLMTVACFLAFQFGFLVFLMTVACVLAFHFDFFGFFLVFFDDCNWFLGLQP